MVEVFESVLALELIDGMGCLEVMDEQVRVKALLAFVEEGVELFTIKALCERQGCFICKLVFTDSEFAMEY
jgi:hypothetical protein